MHCSSHVRQQIKIGTMLISYTKRRCKIAMKYGCAPSYKSNKCMCAQCYISDAEQNKPWYSVHCPSLLGKSVLEDPILHLSVV